MEIAPVIDTSFDVRTDSGGHDPDSHSATLRSYHRRLWSKPLPSGDLFHLDARLRHHSGLGDFWLSSDAIVHTYTQWTRPARLADVIRLVPDPEKTAFYDLACTVGAYLVFPSQVQVNGKWQQTINQRRGFHPRIRDRFDLTLECIRRHYAGEPSPLQDTLEVYGKYLGLFGDFRGYVNHFLLQDLVTSDGTSVRYFQGAGDFSADPLPVADVSEYREYMTRSMAFIHARNDRIASYAAAHLTRST